MQAKYMDYLIRLPFAAVFLYHGFTKLYPGIDEGMANAMVGSTALWVILAIAELAVGILILAGGFTKSLFTKIAGGLGALIMAGAIYKVHGANGFAFNEAAGVGYEFHLVMIGVGLYFALKGDS